MNYKRFIVDALAYRVRVFLKRQLYGLGPRSKAFPRNFRRVLRELREHDLIRQLTVLARPVPQIAGPLIRWRPGDDAPDFAAIQYQAEKRNREAVEPVTVFLGTARLANILGGTCGGPLDQHAVTHDIGVSSVFLHLWKTDEALAHAWQGEDVVAPSRRGQKLPDPILFNPAGEAVMAVEYIGDYPVARIRAFHDDCANRGLPYEMY